MEIEILNYMLDNNIIIMAEYDNWEELNNEHCKILIMETLEIAKNNNDTKIIKKLQKLLTKY